jgi:hypothetical protein
VEPGGARGSQEEPGIAKEDSKIMNRGARMDQEDQKFITGGARRSQGEPGGARRSQEEPGGARITRAFHKRPIGKARGTRQSPGRPGGARRIQDNQDLPQKAYREGQGTWQSPGGHGRPPPKKKIKKNKKNKK